MSVEFLRTKSASGVQHDLVGGAFVNVPSNPSARVLSAKTPARFRDLLTKTIAGEDTSALLQAIHDASAHLGAACVVVQVDDDESGESDGANKAAALALRLKAGLLDRPPHGTCP